MRAHQRQRASARCSASWSRGRRARTPQRADGPHRVQPHRQLRRRAAAARLVGQMIDVTHHRGAAALAARRCRVAGATATSAPARAEAPPPQRERAGRHHRAVGRPCGRRGRRQPARPAPRRRRRTLPAAPAAASDAGQLAPPQQLGQRGGAARRAPAPAANRLTTCQSASSGPIVSSVAARSSQRPAGIPRARRALTCGQRLAAAKPTILT